jgi:hypothetical protein
MIRDKRHLQFIRELECVLCGSPYVEAAHLRWGTDGGTGLKPSDCFVTPLCSPHHRLQHQVGEKTFWEGWQIHDLCRLLWLSSGDHDVCLGHIERARGVKHVGSQQIGERDGEPWE